MPGPGMELIGEEEIQEVLKVLRGGYLFRYGISLGPEVDPRFQGKVLGGRARSGRRLLRPALRGRRQLGDVGPVDGACRPGRRPGRRGDRARLHVHRQHVVGHLFRAPSPCWPRSIARSTSIRKTSKAKITPRTKAIMAVHMTGNPARLDELKAIADARGLFLIEDCAQAFGATYHGRPGRLDRARSALQLQRLQDDHLRRRRHDRHRRRGDLQTLFRLPRSGPFAPADTASRSASGRLSASTSASPSCRRPCSCAQLRKLPQIVQPPADQQAAVQGNHRRRCPASSSASFPIPRATWRRC